MSAAEPTLVDATASLPVAVLLAGPQGIIADVNAACEQLLNQSRRALRQRLLREFVALPDGVTAVYDCELAVEGRSVRVDLTAAELPDYPGWRTVALHRHKLGPGGDRLSTLRSAGGAAAMLAHEIKNPLAGIRGAAQLIAGGAPADELVQLITTEVDRVAALIDRMEDFTDTRPLPLQPLNLYPLLLHARDVARAGFARDVVIDDQFDPSLPPALGDGDALLQVLLNLLLNAAAAVAPLAAPRITLATAYRSGTAVAREPGAAPVALPIEVCVIDNGPGAPLDIAEHLFEPFVSGRPEGKGLGLALVDKLVRDMGGVVEYAREGSPRQTVLRILLPRAHQ